MSSMIFYSLRNICRQKLDAVDSELVLIIKTHPEAPAQENKPQYKS